MFCAIVRFLKHKDRISAIKRLVDVPLKAPQEFWGRESKCLSALIKEFPDEDFWLKVSFNSKFDSLKMLRVGYYHEELSKKYARFHYNLPPPPEVTLGEKMGKDYSVSTKPKTTRDFLN